MAKISKMQQRVNAAKQPTLNIAGVHQCLMQLTAVLTNYDPKQDYCQTPKMTEAATMMAQKFGVLSTPNWEALLTYRCNLEAGTAKTFDVDFVSGVGAFMWDPEQAMKDKNVPQDLRVMHGLLDLVIVKLGMLNGAIVVQSFV